MNQPVTRRLAAILAADVAGYTRLMGLDEEGTLAELRALRRELIDPAIAGHRGRIVKTTGDGLLAEFASVIDAMRCAVETQRAMLARHSASTPQDRRIEFRIGVNLGDIIFEDDDIYGDGVNVAARLEQLATPGGVCISHTVYKECRGKIDGDFADGGDVALKNIAKPVHVWHWRRDKAPSVDPGAAIESEGKPSIAVLPFVNISSDPEKEYFADGITEDIITGLSFDSRLFVTARNSTFVYKGKPVDIRTAGKELGVRYVLEGSIRPMGERLRITVQLIETANGNHVWADKIDRPAAEIFDVMDEVVDGIVTALCSNLGVTEANRAKRQRPGDLQAWALCTQAEVLVATQPGPQSLLQAAELAKRAAEIEPGYAASWAMLGYLTSMQIPWGASADIAKDSDVALSLIDKALRLAPNDPVVLSYCGYAAIWAGQATQAVLYLERSLAINPNSSFARFAYGPALNSAARPRDALTQLQLFIRRSPKDPYIGVANFFLAFCYLSLEDFDLAEQAARNCVAQMPGFGWGNVGLATCLAALGHSAEAHLQIAKALQFAPALTLQAIEDFWRHTFREPSQAEHLIALTRQAWPD